MTTAPTFDPVAYKATTRAQWEQAADAWHRWGPTLEAWLGPATELMLDLAAVTEGSRVLDVAAGAGGQTRAQLPPPAPGQPGPFSLGAPGVLESVLRDAGFVDVEVHRVPAPLRLPSAAECVRFERESFGALHQMLAGLDADAREAAWSEIAERLAGFDRPDGFLGPCELLVAAGRR